MKKFTWTSCIEFFSRCAIEFKKVNMHGVTKVYHITRKAFKPYEPYIQGSVHVGGPLAGFKPLSFVVK